MQSAADRGQLRPVDDEDRGSALKRHREKMGVGVQELATRAGVERSSVTRAEKGEASDTMFGKLERAIVAMAEEMDVDLSAGSDVVELVLESSRRIVRVRGPIADLPEMERSLARLDKLFGETSTTGQDV